VLQHSAEEHTQLPDDSIIDGASSSETFALWCRQHVKSDPKMVCSTNISAT
jgi:hypothetical protein